MDYVQGAWFDAEGHGQSAPELTVELYGHLCAWGPGVNIRGGNRRHRAVEGPSRYDPGEDVGPQEVAHALNQDGLELAARKQAWPRLPVVAAVVLAVGYYGEPRGVDLLPDQHLQWGERVPEEHFERRQLKGQPPQVALQARCHCAYYLRVEAYPGAFAVQYAPAGLGRVERQPELPRQHVRRAERQDAQRGLRREPVQYLVDRAVAPGCHDQTVPRKRRKRGGVVGVLRVEDLHRKASRAQDLRETFQIILVARASRVRVADDDGVCGRVHPYTIALLPAMNLP